MRSSSASAHAIDPAEAAAVLATDRLLLEALLAIPVPTDQGLVDLARLIQRYRLPLWDPAKEPAACCGLRALCCQVLLHWGLSEELLFERTRAIWASGFRPQLELGATGGVGSGSDVAAE
jgi:hypothetical protein